ncbi:MAG TPA: GNAT family N-acetyltransferase [Steroidobacteraceae bacterium]|nr:GNAT family N-acetyltransferase [Steroidobacteraceae bacterium]
MAGRRPTPATLRPCDDRAMATVALPAQTEYRPARRIVPIGKEHLAGFHAALDSVAREGRYLAMLQAPPYASTRRFVLDSLKGGAIHVVALAGDDVVGWCDLRPKAALGLRHSAVLGLGVVRQYRGQGLGSSMLATTLEMAETRGLHRVELVVRADNETAIALYRRFGFVEEGRCRQYLSLDGVSHDALLMARLACEQSA